MANEKKSGKLLISILIGEREHEFLKLQAKQDDRTIASVVRKIISEYIVKQEKITEKFHQVNIFSPKEGKK